MREQAPGAACGLVGRVSLRDAVRVSCAISNSRFATRLNALVARACETEFARQGILVSRFADDVGHARLDDLRPFDSR